MSKFVVGTHQPMCCRISTLKYAALLILGVLIIVNFYDQLNCKQANHIVSDASSVVGSQEWMRKKEAKFEARKAHVREVCAKLSSKYQWVSTEQRYFWFDIKHGIALCAHAKVWLCNVFFIFLHIQSDALHFKCSIVCLTLQKFKLLIPGFPSTCVRCFVCYVLDAVSMHGPKTKHTKHLPQVDGNPGRKIKCH